MDFFNAWYLTRAAAITSYVLLSLSVITGLYGQIRKKHGKTPGLFPTLHVSLANWSLLIAMFHIAILLFDQYVTFTMRELLVPFSTAYKTVPMAIGIIGFYLLVLTIVTTELRNLIGSKVWRKLHMLSPLLYVFVTVHGLWMGTDTQSVNVFSMYAASVASVALLLYLRFKRSTHAAAASA